MTTALTDHSMALWFVDERPARMLYAGQRWRITDTPTRLRASVWEIAPGGAGMCGWRFQATNAADETYVFDVFSTHDGWHVHRCYE